MIFEQTPTSKAMEIIEQVNTLESALFVVKQVEDTIYTDEMCCVEDEFFQRGQVYWEDVKNIIKTMLKPKHKCKHCDNTNPEYLTIETTGFYCLNCDEWTSTK